MQRRSSVLTRLLLTSVFLITAKADLTVHNNTCMMDDLGPQRIKLQKYIVYLKCYSQSASVTHKVHAASLMNACIVSDVVVTSSIFYSL